MPFSLVDVYSITSDHAGRFRINITIRHHYKNPKNTIMHHPDTNYRHLFANGLSVPWPAGKAVCVGRNYSDHIVELNNDVPTEPILFIKPTTAMVSFSGFIKLARRFGIHHYETEMTLLIGKKLQCCNEKEARDAIAGVGVGLDLTLRSLQNSLKAKGHPWERAKAFDGSCVLSRFVILDNTLDLQNIKLCLWRNDELVQNTNTGQMLFPVLTLLCDISRTFTLMPGDIVMTGTPRGVGELLAGDKLKAELDSLITEETIVINDDE